jgi:hypothetical protein
MKFDIIEKEAWKIGLIDPDLVAISQEDDPFIPDDVSDAPVLEVLKRFRS